jgi:VCBS repeat-containing protein
VTGVNDAPTLAGAALAATEDGGAVTLNLSTLGDDADAEDDGSTLSYAIVGAPAEGAASIAGTTLSFDPGAAFQNLGAGQTRAVTVQVQATDARGATSAIRDVVVTVTGVNDAPTLSGPAAVNVLENTTAVASFAAADADAGQTPTFSITGGADAALFAIDAATGALRFIAAPDFEAPADAGGDNVYDVIVGASDGTATTTQAVAVTVTDVDETLPNRAPVAADDSYATGFGDVLTVNAAAGLLANDSDPDLDAISVVLVGSAANGVLNAFTDGSFTYTPNAGFSGTETILYTISDGFAQATATLTIEVAANAAPVAADDSYATGFGDVLTVNAAAGLLANDSDPDLDAISVVLVGSAANGVLNAFTDGSFTYTPNAGFSGTETILYTISDGFAQATATLTIEVAPPGNAAPTPADDAFAVAEDAALSGNLFADNGAGPDSDPDGDALTVTAVNGVAASVGSQVALASGALLTVNADGTFAYDQNGAFDGLDAGETGADSFTYTVSDGKGGAASATVSIAVAGETDLNLVLGTAGNDRLVGTAGADLIRSLGGSLDMATGGGGADVFDFADIVGDGIRQTRYVLDYEQGLDSIDFGGASVISERFISGRLFLGIGPDNDTLVVVGVTASADIDFI